MNNSPAEEGSKQGIVDDTNLDDHISEPGDQSLNPNLEKENPSLTTVLDEFDTTIPEQENVVNNCLDDSPIVEHQTGDVQKNIPAEMSDSQESTSL